MLTEFLDPDHEIMGDAAGDLTDPSIDPADAPEEEAEVVRIPDRDADTVEE